MNSPSISDIAKQLDALSISCIQGTAFLGMPPAQRAELSGQAARFALAAWMLERATPAQVEEIWRGYLQRSKIGEGN